MRKTGTVLTLSAVLLLSACSTGTDTGKGSSGGTAEPSGGGSSAALSGFQRPSLIQGVKASDSDYVVPDLPEYELAPDFSNTINQSLVAAESDKVREKLAENYFVVTNSRWNYEFFEIYEENTYDYVPSFVTTDSMLHTFHLYFAHLQKNVEQTALYDRVLNMSIKMRDASTAQLQQLKGTEWESAAERNVDFFAVGAALLDDPTNFAVSERAKHELEQIMAADGMGVSDLFTTEEREYIQDYSQFTVRGYYTENERLSSYFRSMMWYGQMNFSADSEELSRSALLMNLALKEAALDDWNAVYTTTAFFAGESDDNGYYEYMPVIDGVYGEGADLSAVKDHPDDFDIFRTLVNELPAPRINSMVTGDENIEPDRDAVTRGFRMMGSRFTIDAYIMQRLVYRDLPENSSGERRMLPTALDVPAGLGSDEALRIIQETTDVSRWPDYTKNMEEVRKDVAGFDDTVWNTSISSQWLHMLTELFRESGKGWPKFMQSQAWTDKNLNTFLGNYTELKHDTVLYAKQVIAEMGAAGGEVDPPDDRGYVEPQPAVFRRLAVLADALTAGLEGFGLIGDEDRQAMKNLSDLNNRLADIAVKELKGELPTDEEFDLIRSYGGQLWHLWLKTVENENHVGSYQTYDYPAALVTDIATDPANGVCLQLGTGKAARIITAVCFDGEVRLARGAVYDFYEFEQPVSNRLTDEEWRSMLKDQEGSRMPERPSWIRSFFEDYEYTEPTPEKLGYIGSIYVKVENLNTRDKPSTSGNKLEKLKENFIYTVYEITEAEGYTWYRIGDSRWTADKNGEWVSYWPAS